MPRLDRHLSTTLSIKRSDVRLLLARGRVTVDGQIATNISQLINRFSDVRFDGEPTQSGNARYLMLNKPIGVVSATRDSRHATVLDILDQPFKHELHIVGRLDFNSTGLMLLTNDGQWSRRLSLPEAKLAKRYRVTVEKKLNPEYVAAFRHGMYFEYEGITTRPAELTLLNEFEAEVALVEGRYHQIKRMFGRFNNKVLSIHRVAVGGLTLDPDLPPGHSRELGAADLNAIHEGHLTQRRVEANL